MIFQLFIVNENHKTGHLFQTDFGVQCNEKNILQEFRGLCV